MSRTVIVTVATQSEQLPAGPAQAGVTISLVDAAGAVFGTQAPAAAPFAATFDSVPAGTYTATAHAVDVAGNVLGAPVVSAPFAVEDLTQAVEVPVSVTLTVQ